MNGNLHKYLIIYVFHLSTFSSSKNLYRGAEISCFQVTLNNIGKVKLKIFKVLILYLKPCIMHRLQNKTKTMVTDYGQNNGLMILTYLLNHSIAPSLVMLMHLKTVLSELSRRPWSMKPFLPTCGSTSRKGTTVAGAMYIIGAVEIGLVCKLDNNTT